MTQTPRKRSIGRSVLFVVLGLAVLLLIISIAIALPIFMHQSAGGSGQAVPEGFVSSTSAEGEDGRTRVLSVETLKGEEADLANIRPGDELIVRGSGYDSSIGIYVSICAVPSVPGDKPSPCLGGVPEGALEGEAAGSTEASSSVWITNDWAWQAFATQGFESAEQGTFTAKLLVPESFSETVDCTKSLCAVTTRADHTASSDRVQDMQLPVYFVE